MSGKLALHSIDHGDGPVSLADDRIPSRNLLAYADLASLAVFALVLANDVMRQAFVHWRVSGSIALVAAIIDGPYICGGPVSTVPLILVPSVCACTTWLYLRGQRGALIRSLVILPALAAWFLLASAGAWLIATFVVFVVSCLLMRMPPDLLAEKIAVRRLPLRRPSADSRTLMCLSVGVVMGLAARGRSRS